MAAGGREERGKGLEGESEGEREEPTKREKESWEGSLPLYALDA